MTSNASSGRAALGRLQRRGCTDKVLIALGFLFFLLVVLHIVKKRLVADGDGGIEAAAAETIAANQADPSSPSADRNAAAEAGEASQDPGKTLGDLLDGVEALASASLAAALTSASGAAAVPASGASDALGDAEDGPLAGALVDEASHDEAVATGLKSEL